MKEKAPRNRTLVLTEEDKIKYSKSIIVLSQKAKTEDVINVTINQDSLAAAAFLPSGFVDLLITDPPYNLNKAYNGHDFKKKAFVEYEDYTREWLSRIVHTLKPGATIYICSEWETSLSVYKVLREFFIVRNRITWEREKGRGAKSNWKNCSEDIWFCTRNNDYFFDAEAVKLKRKVIAPYKENGKPKDWKTEENGNFRLTSPSNLWTDISVPFWSMPENTDHPTQKPEKLLAKLILASSRPGDVVFDPFLGSGTTSVVAKKLGRRYVGVELNNEYACLAEKRLEIADHNKTIQGFSGGFFWERNTLAMQKMERQTNPENTFQERLLIQMDILENLIGFIESHKMVNDKNKLALMVKEQFSLTKDRSVFYNSQLAIRFSKANSTNFSNTVLGLSALQKYDDRPFIVCLVIQDKNVLLLANSTFLKKISHTSQALRVDNIRGSFNGSDIFREFNEIPNSPENFEDLFEIHKQIPFEENLARLVEATNGIAPTGKKFAVSEENKISILDAPLRAKNFSEAMEFRQLKDELDALVKRF